MSQRGPESVCETPETGPVADQPPPVRVQDDMDTLVPEPGPLVEAMLRRSWQAHGCDRLEQGALRRCAPERKLQQNRLAKTKSAEATDIGGYAHGEARRARRAGDDEQRSLGGVDARKQDAAIESVEARASPPPAGEKENRKKESRAWDSLLRSRADGDQCGAQKGSEQGHARHVGAGDPGAEGGHAHVRRSRGGAHGRVL